MTGLSLLSIRRRASNLQLRSSIFIQVADMGLLIPRAPGGHGTSLSNLFFDIPRKIVKKNSQIFRVSIKNEPEMSSSSDIRSLSISGGSLLEKKSFSAVATALTGMSKE